MIYLIEYLPEDGSRYFELFEDENERDFVFNSYKGVDLIRRRNFKEVDLNESDKQSTPNH